MKTDVLVVGAGPAGLLTSIFINKHDVLIIEEHNDVGIPKHCAGFVSKYYAEEIVSITGRDVLDNYYNSLVFHIHNRKYNIYFKEPFIYRINRPLLEHRLADIVYSKNHRIIFNTKGKPTSSLNKVLTKNCEIHCSKIIVADGSNSIFRKHFFKKYKSRLIGIQYIYRSSSQDMNTIHLLFNNLTPDFFQWLAPIDRDSILIGFASSNYFFTPDTIVKHIVKKTGVQIGSKVEVFGGIIPFDKPLKQPIIGDKLFFIGDSVPVIKPYTGGGLLNILLLSTALGMSIDNNKPSLYLRIYELIRSRIIYEYIAVSFFKKIGYWIPPRIVYTLYRRNLLNPSDYDNHYRLLTRSLKIIPQLIIEILLDKLWRND
ncbi:MAG: NAD(P)/FAD-dependent oxidoreductase [Desulfurococcaceae archaeon]